MGEQISLMGLEDVKRKVGKNQAPNTFGEKSDDFSPQVFFRSVPVAQSKS